VDLQSIEEALKVNVCYQVLLVTKQLSKSKESQAKKLNSIFANEIVKMSRTHTKYVQFKLFKNMLEQ
jgi:hypothetical protein